MLEWKGIVHAMACHEINALSLQEPNTHWNEHLQMRVQTTLQKSFHWAILATSNSTKPSWKTHQPGGTVTAIVGAYASRLLSKGQDPSSMGWWSFVKLLGKLNKQLIIASIYCVRAQKARIGSNTVSTQQIQILLCKEHAHPWPCQQLFHNLIQQITQWQLTGHKILLCMDANEDTALPNPEIRYGKLLHVTGLVDLHHIRHPALPTPATYNQGNLTIDVCIRSQLFIDTLVGAWIMPFGFPSTITGDHRMLGHEFNTDVSFGNKLSQPEETKATQGIYSNNMPMVQEFNDQVTKDCKSWQLFQRTPQLYHKYLLTALDHQELEKHWPNPHQNPSLSWPEVPQIQLDFVVTNITLYIPHPLLLEDLTQQSPYREAKNLTRKWENHLLQLAHNLETTPRNQTTAMSEWAAYLHALADAAGQTNNIKNANLSCTWSMLKRINDALDWYANSWNPDHQEDSLSYASLTQNIMTNGSS